jgi:hypothetical protein
LAVGATPGGASIDPEILTGMVGCSVSPQPTMINTITASNTRTTKTNE